MSGWSVKLHPYLTRAREGYIHHLYVLLAHDDIVVNVVAVLGMVVVVVVLAMVYLAVVFCLSSFCINPGCDQKICRFAFM